MHGATTHIGACIVAVHVPAVPWLALTAKRWISSSWTCRLRELNTDRTVPLCVLLGTLYHNVPNVHQRVPHMWTSSLCKQVADLTVYPI